MARTKRKFRSRHLALATLACFVALSTPVANFAGTGPIRASAAVDATIFSGTVDASNATASRWVSTKWTPATSATVTAILNFDSSANVRIEVRENGQWLAADTSLSNPKSVELSVQAGAEYIIAVWAMQGASPFTVTVSLPTGSTLLQGVLDSASQAGPRWTSTNWQAPQTGNVDMTLTWATASADIRATVTRAQDGAWIANLYGANGLATKSVPTQAGTTYQISAWAESGSSSFQVALAGGGTPPADGRPNILVIMTDDQRRDSLDVMPKLKKWMADQGTKFTEGYVTTPSCCPARASVLTGQYNHNNGVISQAGPPFDENTSIARYLSDAGYATAHIGKYVHYLDLQDRAPNWDKWTYYKGGYNNIWMNVDGNIVKPGVYATRFAFDKAIEYADSFKTADDEQPWLMHVWPTAPHRVGNNPPEPEDIYQNAPVPVFEWEPRTFESDVSDKPQFIYCCPNATSLEYISLVRRQMLRSLYSVDDGVDRLLTHLQNTGELDNTLVFFLSDNGWMFGDHNLHEKFVPYENSVGVPFMMRWPGKIAANQTSDRLVSNIDILPTALGAAGVTIPANVDGQDILNSAPRPFRFTEYFNDPGNIPGIKTWASAATDEYEYIEWYENNGNIAFREFYNRTLDPFQLLNLLGDTNTSNDPGSALLTSMRDLLTSGKSCSGSSCP